MVGQVRPSGWNAPQIEQAGRQARDARQQTGVVPRVSPTTALFEPMPVRPEQLRPGLVDEFQLPGPERGAEADPTEVGLAEMFESQWWRDYKWPVIFGGALGLYALGYYLVKIRK